jgi:hypothetical protein
MHTSTLIHSHFLYTYPSFLLYESRPHADHIYVHVYADVLHEYQIAIYTDLGCTLLFTYEYAKSNPRPVPSMCVAFSFIVMTSILILLIVF